MAGSQAKDGDKSSTASPRLVDGVLGHKIFHHSDACQFRSRVLTSVPCFPSMEKFSTYGLASLSVGGNLLSRLLLGFRFLQLRLRSQDFSIEITGNVSKTVHRQLHTKSHRTETPLSFDEWEVQREAGGTARVLGQEYTDQRALSLSRNDEKSLTLLATTWLS